MALGNMVLNITQWHRRGDMKNGIHRIAWNIRRIRVEQGLSQERLAIDSGVDRSYVSRLERGLENPTIAMLERMAQALNIHVADLLAYPSGPRPKPLPSGRRKPVKYVR